MPHLLTSRGDPTSNGLGTVGRPLAQPTRQFIERRRQDEHANRRREPSAHLLRTLPVDLQQNVLACVQGSFDAASRCAIVVAMHFCPFEELALTNLVEKVRHVREVVLDTVPLASARCARRVRN